MGEGNEGGELRLSEEQLREMMTKAAQEAVAEERQRWDTDKAALEARLSQEEAESHRLRVDQQISAYQEKGVPPAVLTRVRELMLAQPSEGGELKLSQPDADGKPKEVTLSFGDAVQSILDSIPEALLEKGQKDLSLAHGGNGGQPPEGDDPNASIEKKVDSLIEFMKGGPAVHAE